MKYVTLLFLVAFVICGCSSSSRPPGQTVASDDHFDNGVKQYEKSHIKQAIQKDSDNYKAYYFLGLCYKERHAQKTSFKYFQKAIDLNPKDESRVIKVKAEMKTVASAKSKKK